jgi:hypothetical protein
LPRKERAAQRWADILQFMNSAVRNLGLMVMGHPILLKPDPGRLQH